MNTAKILPPSYLLASMLMMLALHFVFPVVRIIPLPWGIAGIVSIACGIALEVVADRAFSRAKTTVNSFGRPTTLVTTGAFSLSRNPMYVGFVLILIGVAAILGTLTPFLIIPVFAVLMDRVFVTFEERMLEEQFGPAWLEYRRRVRRWI